MMNFLVGTLLWAVVLGVFAGMLFTVEMRGIGRVVAVIVIALVIGAIISAVFCAENTADHQRWNGGYCPDCGVRWALVNVEHLRNSGEVYYWNCPQCGTIIKLHRQF